MIGEFKICKKCGRIKPIWQFTAHRYSTYSGKGKNRVYVGDRIERELTCGDCKYSKINYKTILIKYENENENENNLTECQIKELQDIIHRIQRKIDLLIKYKLGL